ncbi:MAG: hypothetical protein AAFU79_31905 [Myxococcota bacterium]
MWGAIKRWLGLTRETRAYISAPGIDVVITGEPHRVRVLLGVVTAALERAELPARTDPSVVEPSELDDRDSPYSIPRAPARPGPRKPRAEVEDTWQLPGRGADRRTRTAPAPQPHPSLKPEPTEREPLPRRRPPPRAPSLSMGSSDEHEAERTAIDYDPRGTSGEDPETS